jgi:tRNA(adenine34) deaminase
MRRRRAALAALAVTHALQTTPHRLPPLAATSLAVDEATTLPFGPARDEAAMAIALDEARAAASRGEVPVGAVVVDDATGTIIARAGNAVEASHDATAHAELRALRAAAQSVRNWRLQDATLYCTLEPCVVCLGAAYAFRVPRVVFGAPDHRLGAAGSWLDLPAETHPFHALAIRGGVRADESARLLKDFFRDRRKAGPRM